VGRGDVSVQNSTADLKQEMVELSSMSQVIDGGQARSYYYGDDGRSLAPPVFSQLIAIGVRKRRDQAFIQLRSGKPFWPTDPNVEDLTVEDIAFGLSNAVRFGNQSPRYTVAQHAVLTSRFVPANAVSLLPRWALHHDDSESVLHDIPRQLQSAIYGKFGLLGDEPDEVKVVDRRMFATEVRDLMSPWCGLEELPEPYSERIRVWSPRRAEREYLSRHRQLFGIRRTFFQMIGFD
jgi:uncharacterized protein